MNIVSAIAESFFLGLFSILIIGVFGFGLYFLIKDFINDREARLRTLIILGIIIFCTIVGFVIRLFL